MLRCTMAVLVVATSAVLASAGGQPANKVSGKWKKTAGEVTLKFEFKGKTLLFSMEDGSKSLKVSADYSVSKDGFVFGRVSKVEKDGIDDGPNEGDLFSFRAEMTKDTLNVSELRGTDSDQARQLIQGEYKGAPAKKKEAK